MNKKIFISAVLATATLFGSFQVSALERSDYNLNDSVIAYNAYFGDESQNISVPAKETIKKVIQQTADDIHINIAVYAGVAERTDDEIDELAQFGADNLFNTQSNDNGTVFLYFDYTNDGEAYDVIYTDSSAGRYYDSQNIGEILEKMQNTVSVNQSLGEEQALVQGINEFCRQLAAYKRQYYEKDSIDQYFYDYATTSYYDYDYFKNNTVYYCDESQIFSDDEKQQIIDLLQDTSSQIGFNLAVYTAGADRSDSQVEDFADTGSREIFGTSPETGTVFLYVDLDGYANAYDYMYCYREPFLYYTSDIFGNRIDKILEAMQEKFPSGGSEIIFSDIYDGLKEFCHQLIYYKEQGPENDCYYYNSDTNTFFTVSWGKIVETATKPRPFKNWKIVLLIGGGIGVIAAFLMYFMVQKHYQFKVSTSASVYTSNEKIFIRSHVDQFLGTDVTRVRIQTDSGGHSSHGSHGGGHSSHSGGGHSGGGGGGRHR